MNKEVVKWVCKGSFRKALKEEHGLYFSNYFFKHILKWEREL